VIVILGVVILVAAVIVGVDGVLSNGGSAHALNHGFAVLGYHVTGSSGTLFLSGMVVGAAGLLGLSVLLAGARRSSRRGGAARRRLQQSRRETAAASQERDQLIGQRDAARAGAVSTPDDGTPPSNREISLPDSQPRHPRLLGRWSSSRRPATARPESMIGQPSPEVLAGSAAPSD
jgi:hypothetical protein